MTEIYMQILNKTFLDLNLAYKNLKHFIVMLYFYNFQCSSITGIKYFDIKIFLCWRN